jgi:uncharacterized protein (DUF924 family)
MGVNDTNVQDAVPEDVPEETRDRDATELLDEWFGDARRSGSPAAWWFSSDQARDARLNARFGPLLHAAAAGELAGWSATPRGRLALILLLDQLPRNCFRGSAAAFATDGRALAETQHGLLRGDDRALDAWERMFFYMPMQHAEDAAVQEQAVDRYAALAIEAPPETRDAFAGVLEYARLHRDIVRRFGRFPHRNALLGRDSTPAEREWLAAGAPDFGQSAAP